MFLIWPFQNTSSGLFTNLTPLLQKEIGISALAFGVILSVRSATSTIAGFWSGFQMDLWGRRSVLILGSLFLMAGFSMVALASSYDQVLLGAAVVTGIGMGLTYAVGNIYLSEWAPTKIRAKWNKLSRVVPSDAVASLIAIGSISLGWRTGMWIGALLPTLGLIVAFMIPESARWLQSRGKWSQADKLLSRIEEKAKVPPYTPKPGQMYKLPEKEKIAVWELFAHGYWKRTIPLSLISCAQWGGSRTVMYWMPVLLAAQMGAATSVQVMLGIGAASYMVSAVMGATGWIEHGQRRDWNMLVQALQCVFMLAFTLNTAWWWALIFGMLWQGSGGLGAGVYSMELYPTRIRGFAVSFATYTVGKCFSIVSPMIIAFITILIPGYWGPFVWAAGMNVLSFLSYLALPRKTAGIAIEKTGETKTSQTEAVKAK
jgi:putative MFS transporter